MSRRTCSGKAPRRSDRTKKTGEAFGELVEARRGRRKFRAGSASLPDLYLLVDCPVITVKRLADGFDILKPQARAAIGQLVAAGILVEPTGRRRNRVFAAEAAPAIVNRPFGAAPET